MKLYRVQRMGSELHKRNNKVGSRGTAGPEKVKYYLLRMESPVKGEDMKREWLHNTKISENVGVRSFWKLETSEFRSFLEIENIGKFRSFRKSNNEQIHIPRKLTGVPGCVRTVGTDSNRHTQWHWWNWPDTSPRTRHRSGHGWNAPRTPCMRGRDQRCPKRSRKEISGTRGIMSKRTYKLFAQVEGKRHAQVGHVGSMGMLPGRGTSRSREERWHDEDVWWEWWRWNR